MVTSNEADDPNTEEKFEELDKSDKDVEDLSFNLNQS